MKEAVALLGKMAAPAVTERRLMVELLLQDICGAKATGAEGAEQLLRACNGLKRHCEAALEEARAAAKGGGDPRSKAAVDKSLADVCFSVNVQANPLLNTQSTPLFHRTDVAGTDYARLSLSRGSTLRGLVNRCVSLSVAGAS